MQIAKDSVLMALQSRLAALDATRTATIGGVTRPAVAAIENEQAQADASQPGVFFLRWGASQATLIAMQSAHEMELRIDYYVLGSDGAGGYDRGRQLGALDELLGRMLWPRSTAMMDYTQATPTAIGGVAMWTPPVFEATREEGGGLRRRATVKVYYFAEAKA